jgi:hypothetical protein
VVRDPSLSNPFEDALEECFELSNSRKGEGRLHNKVVVARFIVTLSFSSEQDVVAIRRSA